MIELRDKERNKLLGRISKEQLQFLIDHLEKESEADVDYYISRATLAMMAERGADKTLIALIKKGMGRRSDIEIEWSRVYDGGSEPSQERRQIGVTQRKKTEKLLNIHILSHTHWDFEWYEIHEGFKSQLVQLIDNLLDTLKVNPNYRFHFDGQVMPIWDYLEVLRENDALDNRNRAGAAEKRIRYFVRNGQLQIGPCWTTPETSMISLESLIRNLNRGMRYADRLGGASPVFYNADAFQYHSQVPQIIKGAGLKWAYTWRAFKEGKALKDMSIWKGADNTRVFKYHPARTYAQIWHLPDDIETAARIIQREAEYMKKFASGDDVLITQGNDQFEAQPDLIKLLKKVNAVIGGGHRVKQTALPVFFKKMGSQKLNTITGELTSNKWACTMNGQLSARMYLKQKNKIAELEIEKWAEPCSTFAWILGRNYPAGLIERAWEFLMKQHFHHCNACAVDDVHREGVVRYNNAIELASDAAQESMAFTASMIDTEKMIHPWESAVVVFNPSNHLRDEVVQVSVSRKFGKQAKDADWQLRKKNTDQEFPSGSDLVIWNDKREQIPCQLIDSSNGNYNMAFQADAIPPFGYATFGIDYSGDLSFRLAGQIADMEKHCMENEFLKIDISSSGVFSILDKRNGHVYKNLNLLEDLADRGDTYNFDPLKDDRPLYSNKLSGSLDLRVNGPLIATYAVSVEMPVPAALNAERSARSSGKIKMPVCFEITLKKASPVVHVKAKIENVARDHRLRVMFDAVESDWIYVQTQGDVVKRKLKSPKAYPESYRRNLTHHTSIGPLPRENAPSSTHFQRDFVAMHDGKKGLAVFNRGLPEYEASSIGIISLTLLRAVGWLSQGDLSTRVGLAGPKIAVPDAQCAGAHTFEYMLMPLAGSWQTSQVFRQRTLWRTAPRHLQVAHQTGSLPPALSSLRVLPEEIDVMAVKKAYRDDTVIVRLLNPLNRKLTGRLWTHRTLSGAWQTDLNENEQKKLGVSKKRTIVFEIKPKRILTLKLQYTSA